MLEWSFVYIVFMANKINISLLFEPLYVLPTRLTNTQECLESSLQEKENTLAKTSEKLELIAGLHESLSQKELQLKEVSDKLLQSELSVSCSLLAPVLLLFVSTINSLTVFSSV